MNDTDFGLWLKVYSHAIKTTNWHFAKSVRKQLDEISTKLDCFFDPFVGWMKKDNKKFNAFFVNSGPCQINSKDEMVNRAAIKMYISELRAEADKFLAEMGVNEFSELDLLTLKAEIILQSYRNN